jgi:hypothetical protein
MYANSFMEPKRRTAEMPPLRCSIRVLQNLGGNPSQLCWGKRHIYRLGETLAGVHHHGEFLD